MRRWCGVCSYDGTSFGGWQSQPDGNAVQDFIEGRLEQIFRRHISAIGSGRTDAGVHAIGQVFHFDAEWSHGEGALLRALRCGLPCAIRLLNVLPISDDFHARFSAVGKRYTYAMQRGFADPFSCRYSWSLGDGPMDIGAMAAAAQIFIGTNDFANFSNSSDCKDARRTMCRSHIGSDGDKITYATEGNGYLYRMVRRIVGAIVDVGRGKVEIDFLEQLLQNPTERPVRHLQCAPARGLFMERPVYGKELDQLIFGETDNGN